MNHPLNTRTLLISLCLSSSLYTSGCMYPGMDKHKPMGNAVAQTTTAQIAYPNHAEELKETVVTGTDGRHSELILEQHRNKVDSANSVDKPISINIGK